MKKFTIVGTGYVGMSLSALLSKHHNVTALDIDKDRVDRINNRISPIIDSEIERYFLDEDLNLRATTDKIDAYSNAEFIVIATPTDYDPESNSFDTSSVESVIEDIKKDQDNNSTIIIKSTIPMGFTKKMNDKYNCNNIIFSPEFLREGNALWDNLNPSRIIIGQKSKIAREFANILIKCSNLSSDSIPVILTNPEEAEAIKLFSNSYLALRVSYFNELDTYCEVHELDSRDVINGLCFDPRIGNYYNNPSFGYGGYCLPKDTKQLLANYKGIPNNIISAIVESNNTRKEFIVESILKEEPNIVGIYSLAMKQGSDNYRYSAIQDVMHNLDSRGIDIMIYEPSYSSDFFDGFRVINCLNEFKSGSDIIVSNRMHEDLQDVIHKLYTRDIFFRD